MSATAAELHLLGQLTGASDFPLSTLFCKFAIEAGSNQHSPPAPYKAPSLNRFKRDQLTFGMPMAERRAAAELSTEGTSRYSGYATG